MMITARRLCAALLLVCAPVVAFDGVARAAPQAASAPAQTEPGGDLSPPKAGQRLDQLSATLTGVETSLKNGKASDADLVDMRATLKRILTQSQAIADRITPVAAALKTRLDQIGPAPAAKAPPEAPELTKERTEAQKTYDEVNGLLTRAKLLATAARQDDDFVSARQRAAFSQNLFQHDTSIFYPPLWADVIAETPENFNRLMLTFNGWVSGFVSNLSGGRMFIFLGGLAVIVVAYFPLMWVVRRILHRDPAVADPSRWMKVLLACWVSLSVPVVLIGLMYAIAYLCASFAVPDTHLQPLFLEIQTGVIRIALAIGLARGIFAPDAKDWRLWRLDNNTCAKLIRITIAIATILTGTRILEAVNEAIYASLAFSVATRGTGALLVAIASASALYSLGGSQGDGQDKSIAEPVTSREWTGLARGLSWTVVIAVSLAVLTGYISFANFLVQQIELVAATGALYYLAVSFTDEAVVAGFTPSTMVGRSLMYMIGLRREGLDQLAILLAGLIKLVLIVVAALVVMVPWGLQSSDIPSNLYAIFFGFKVGDITISLSGIALAFLVFVGVIAASRGIQGWLENRYLPLTRLDSGLQNSIKTSLGYAGFLLALALAAAFLGVDFQKVAIVAGALSVGIGFGLQSIVNNFVSGLILLWERAVRVGDWIVVGADQGYVRRINVRSTEIETFDRASVIIPNSNLVSGVVKNLMRADKVGRLMIEVTVNAAADPEKVREVLLEIARAQDDVLSMPSPQVRFTNLTASALTFDLYCFVADVEAVLRTKSDLFFEIHKQFGVHGFFNGPAPDPLSIKIDGLDKLETILHGTGAKAVLPGKSA